MSLHTLPLSRPLVFLDVESTGKDPMVDRICELSLVKYHPGGAVETWTRYLNPQCPGNPEAISVHGLTDLFLAPFPTFQDRLPEMLAFLANCDLGGYNILRFDLPILMEAFNRCGVEEWPAEDTKVVDAFVIFSKLNPRTLAAAVQQYLGHELDGAHGAEADTRATAQVFEAQLRAHGEVIGTTVHEWHQHCYNDALVDYAAKLARDANGVIVFNFGQHKGKPVISERGYANWMLSKDFPAQTKRKLRLALASN